MRTTAQERLALGTVALLLALGAGVRGVGAPAPEAEWSGGGPERAPVARVEAEVADEERRSRPLSPGERLDANLADAGELDRLPRVGPALAARIVARREAKGAFRTLGDLDSVAGVGPALLAALAPHLTLPPAPTARRSTGGNVAGGAVRSASRNPAPSARRTAGATPAADGQPLDLNRASAAELDLLPGVGPALAARILESRDRDGPFPNVEALARVKGIGEQKLLRIAPLVRASP